MKSWMKAAAAGAAVALLAACGTDRAAEPVMPQESAAKTEAANAEGKEGKVLIAYFTWAENTHVDDPSSVDPDASTSASVLPPGNTAKMAGWIQKRTGGDLFPIRVKEPYSSDYEE